MNLQVDLDADGFGEKQFVTVGWGKKETQFHGSEGKSARNVKVCATAKTEHDDGSACVTWKDDGSLFAVSFVKMPEDARQIKVFDRSGVLQSTSEPSEGLEEIISWKPGTNLIAAVRRLPNKHVVSFFEKNGLMHKEFCLPFTPKEIKVNSNFIVV